MESSKWITRGKAAHTEKEYDQAITYFTKALNSSQLHPEVDKIHILDLRIASYVKKSELTLATKDAKGMIHIDRKDGRGYLRCGQLARRNQDYEGAKKWYEHGLRQVSPDDALYRTIQEQLEKTKAAHLQYLLESKPHDPLAILPSEIRTLILSNLSYKQHVRLLGVSKLWFDTLSLAPPLSNTIDLRNTLKILPTHVNAIIRRLKGPPLAVYLPLISPQIQDFLRQRLSTWLKMGTLKYVDVESLAMCVHPKGTTLHFGSAEFQHYAQALSGLRVLRIQSGVVHEDMIVHLLNTSTLLEEFTIINLRSRDRQRILQLCESSPPNENLRKLDIRGNVTRENKLRIKIEDLQRFSNLESLSLHQVDFRNAIDFDGDTPTDMSFADMSCLTSLRHLHLNCLELSQASIFPPNLICLKIPGETLHQYNGSEAPKTRTLSQLRSLSTVNDYSLQFLRRTDRDMVTSFLSDCLVHLHEPGQESLLAELDLETERADRGVIDMALWPQVFDKKRCCLKNLDFLRLCGFYINDDIADILALHLPNLVELHIVETPHLTGLFLKKLLDRQHHRIKSVFFKYCSVDWYDAVEWARGRGVQILIRNGIQERAVNSQHPRLRH